MADDDVVQKLLGELKGLIGGETEKPTVVATQKIAREKQIVREIVDKLEESQGENIIEDDIVEAAKKKDVTERDARTAIEDLVRDGYLQRPDHMSGIVRIHGRTEFQRWGQEFPG